MMTDFRELSLYNGTGFFDTKTQMRDYIYAASQKYFDIGRQKREAIDSLESLKKRQQEVRSAFFKSIGGLPCSAASLDVQKTGTVNHPAFQVEKLLFQSRKNCYVPANLYKPNTAKTAFPAILFLCGHDKLAKNSAEYQAVCQHLVQKGFIVLAMDPIGQGERLSYYAKGLDEEWGTAEHSRAGFQCLMTGKPIARYFVHDAIRAVDYLCTREDVIHSQIAVTGNSGGGTQTAMMMLADSRIAAAAPATFLTTREQNIWTGLAQDGEQCWPGLLSACGFDHQDIALAFAPKPLLLVAAKSDFFPYEGTKEVFETALKYWKLSGAPENLQQFADDSTHKYTCNMANAVGDFFAGVFLPNAKIARSPHNLYHVTEYRQLLCTETGQVNTSSYQNKTVFEENLNLLDALDKRTDFLSWIKEKLYFNRLEAALNPRCVADLHLEAEKLVVKNIYWFSQKQVLNQAFLFMPEQCAGQKLPVTVCVWKDGSHAIEKNSSFIQAQCNKNRAVLILNTTGTGALAPHPVNLRPTGEMYATLYKFSDDLYWLGDSIAALRSYDVLRCLKLIEELPFLDTEQPVFLHTAGEHGIYAYNALQVFKKSHSIELFWSQKPAGFQAFCKDPFYNPQRVWEWIIPEMLNFYE